MSDQTLDAAAILTQANSLLVLTGAGISAESGVPTYRDTDGRYSDPDTIMYAEDVVSNPAKVWKYVDSVRQTVAGCKPNRAHEILAEWEHANRFERFLIATQNIDGFHNDAGNKRVTELHGNIWQVAEPRTESVDFEDDYFALQDEGMKEEVLARWSKENKHRVWENRDVPFERIPPYPDPAIRPNVVFFNESYGQRLLWVQDFISRSVDAILVIGCSGAVWTLQELVNQALAQSPAAKVININPTENCLPEADAYLDLPATIGLERIHKHIDG
jgi:NAD-dependent deacetylase